MEHLSNEQQSANFPSKRRGNRNKKQNTNEAQLSIEDALKNVNIAEIRCMPIKTPVSILQELLSRRGITPSYELVQIEGAIHEPTFRYRVSFCDNDAMGAGKSKKDAKHAAAQTLIDKLTCVPFTETLIVANTNGSAATEPTTNNFEDKVLSNSIGLLQELCLARGWTPPTYETDMKVGLPHERQFTIGCVVLKYRDIGQGKSKQIAKRLAAHKMWVRLHDSPLDHNQINQLIVDEDGNDEISHITNILNGYVDHKDAYIPTLTYQHNFKVSQFHTTLKATFGKNLTALQATCLNDKEVNYIQFLQEIGSEHQFEVTYFDIEEKTYLGRCQCLVQLSILPVAVCQGSGATSKNAKSSAARNALEYLKIMTKM